MLASRQEQGEWIWVNQRETFIPYRPPGSYYATGAVPVHNEPFLVGDEMLVIFNTFCVEPAQRCPAIMRVSPDLAAADRNRVRGKPWLT